MKESLKRIDGLLNAATDLGADKINVMACDLVRLRKFYEEAKVALIYVANRGGNLPDSAHLTRSGPNDAAARGAMYVDGRECVRNLLTQYNITEGVLELRKE